MIKRDITILVDYADRVWGFHFEIGQVVSLKYCSTLRGHDVKQIEYTFSDWIPIEQARAICQRMKQQNQGAA